MSGSTAEMIDLDAVRKATVIADPFEYFLVPKAIRAEHLAAIRKDFPPILQGGSFPLASLTYGPAFEQLTDELMGEPLKEILAEKLKIDLADRPATLTVRGRTRTKDGQIHIDSQTKLVTVLLYLNPAWDQPGGRLRLLRNEYDLENYVAEVPPEEGSLVAFRCRSNAWHGHHPFEGERRSMQLNYVTSASASRWASLRHSVSAAVKRLVG
jgi:SM-20-related protein